MNDKQKRNVTIRKKIEKNTHKYYRYLGTAAMTVKFVKINTFKKVCHFSCARVVPYIEKERGKEKYN